MTIQVRSVIGGNTGPAKTGDADQGDVNLVDELPSKVETEKVTATVSSGARPGSDTPTLAEFMSAVVAWPLSPEDPGYVNLHYSSVDRDNPNGPLRKGSGWPFRDLGSFVSRAVWINTTAQFKDVWYCLSLQSQTRPNPWAPTKPKAHRLAANALKVKSIWIDVDVGDDPKKYGTVEEALKAVLLFQKTAGLPTPSAIVYSGGGIHVYWISKDPLTREQWLPYASGLKTLLLTNAVKCDTGLTTDIARILRVPGTFNHKYDPPKPVTLAPLSLIMYDFAKLDFLKQFAAPIKQAAKPQHNIFADGITDAQRASFTQPPPFKVGEPDLNAGINKFDDTPLKIEPIFKQCGFYKEALLTGGANYNQALWMYSILGATFMENGNAVAHAISKGHASYTPAETEEMYDRKVADRRDRGIGYPQCATIQGAGCQACAACPHFAKGKSPLNLGIPSAAQHADATTEAASGPTASAQHSDDAAEAASGPTASPPPELKVSFAHIPHRAWLYGVDLVRKDITLMASPGGAGKTSLALGMAACLATGKALLGEKIWGSDPLKSLYINAEDSRVEMLRRACAFCQQHGISELELDRLHLIGAEDPRVQGISFLRAAGPSSSILDQAGFAQLEGLLISLRPDLIVLDPLIALCGGGNVNDNAVMSLVMRELKKLAMKYNCAILIVLHTTKGGDLSNANAISGASAIKDLARHAMMPVTMTEDDRKVFGLLPSERRQYFKLVDAKSNLAPLSGETWYKLENQELPNAEPPTYPHGDRVQAVVRANLTSSKASSAVDPKRETIRFELLKLIERGLMIDGESVPYSPNSTGKNKMRAILDHAMAAVRGASTDREYSSADLRAVAERELEALKHDGWAVVEPIKKGRFRRSQGLRPVWERTPWAKERAALHEHGGPTVRTEDEERELHRSDLEEFLRD
jgi:hypothetical protein